jgi:hypothetical protein
MIMNENRSIKRCVSFFCFQEEYFLGKLNVENCIAVAARLDIPGIEIIGDQMIPGYPEIPNDFLEKWHAWMEKYERIPVCLDTFLDFNKYKNRRMTDDEVLATIVKDIQNARKLGCSLIRINHDVSPLVLEKAAPAAEKYGVRLGLEIHAPHHFDHEFEQRHIEMMNRVQSPSLGFLVDTSIFADRFPRVVSDRWVRDGMDPAIASYFVENYSAHNSLDYVCDQVIKMGARAEDIGMVFYGVRHNLYSNPERMLDYMPFIFHVHAKFNEMQEDCTEDSIPYDQIIPVLQQGGYHGYLSSEYEGGLHIGDIEEVDGVEQVRRHQVMLTRLLAVDQQVAVRLPVSVR